MNTENSIGKWLLLQILFLKTCFFISVRKYKDMEFFMDFWVKISHQSQQIDKEYCYLWLIMKLQYSNVL